MSGCEWCPRGPAGCSRAEIPGGCESYRRAKFGDGPITSPAPRAAQAPGVPVPGSKAAEIRDRLELVRGCDYRVRNEECGCAARFVCLRGVSRWDDLRVSDRDCLECVSQSP